MVEPKESQELSLKERIKQRIDDDNMDELDAINMLLYILQIAQEECNKEKIVV